MNGVLISLLLCLAGQSQDALKTYTQRGFDASKIALPEKGATFPVGRLKNPLITQIASFPLFPEGPSYRPKDDSVFFAGNIGLTRVTRDRKLQVVVEKPGGGGTHPLPDGSMLLVGHVGLRRIMPDGRIALLADGSMIGAGNDLTVGIHGELYFTVPKKQAIYRLAPGPDGKLERVTTKGGNGLDVDPSGRFLYVNRGIRIVRYSITGADQPLGPEEVAFRFEKSDGGTDGCAFDAWGNYYTVHFQSGLISVIDPEKRALLGRIDPGVKPATNVSFGGPAATELYVTAGVPRVKNCQLLRIDLGITGFCGHVGATDYPVLRWMEERANVKALN